MGYFDSKKNAEEYIKMAKGYDGRALIQELKKHLPKGSSVLELGMGPGIDLDILSATYKVTGSDYSQVFIDLYKKKNPDSDLLLLDAVSMTTNRKFDCIYSNKVLIHLTKNELKTSLSNQCPAINDNGILFHSFWYDDKEEEYHGLRFTYYTEKTIQERIPKNFKLIELKRYKEMKKDDSFYLILRKTSEQFHLKDS